MASVVMLIPGLGPKWTLHGYENALLLRTSVDLSSVSMIDLIVFRRLGDCSWLNQCSDDYRHLGLGLNNMDHGLSPACDVDFTSHRFMLCYPIPVSDRPENGNKASDLNLKLPVIDLAQLLTSKRHEVLQKLKRACEEYGFFQVVNHGIDTEQAARMVDVGKRFFEQPFEQRKKYMSSDIRTPVRCGTSVNQLNDGVFYWRDFLKLTCHPLDDILQYWPTTPADFREEATSYAQKTKLVFLHIMGAITETLGLKKDIIEDFKDGTHMMVVNCYPACPEPNLTLGMPPHSDYGFLTLLLQDEVHGLQVQCNNKWVTVEPVPGSFVVNVGDHLEIFSNGRYKSVLHRVLVNPSKTRISVASLHSLPFDCMIKPAPELVNDENPKLYKDTDFASFLNYLSSRETKQKNFLESRKINAGH